MNKTKQRSDSVAFEDRDFRIYRLRICLAETAPPVWRRLEVYAGMEMDSLATAIDTLFGWSGDHLGGFAVKGRTIGDDGNWTLNDPAHLEASADEKERDVPTLCDLVPRVRTRFTYTYDFGDDWKHLIEVEKIAAAEPGIRYPRCTDGARANPIEDCGGPWGFSELVEAAGNPKHERYADLEEWGLKKWNPAKFSVERANRELARVFRLTK